MAAYTFYPGKTILIALTTVGSANVSPTTDSGTQAIKIDNLSTNNAFGVFNLTSTGTVATLPTTAAASAQFGWSVPYGRTEYFVCPPGAYVSALTTGASLTAILAITNGQVM